MCPFNIRSSELALLWHHRVPGECRPRVTGDRFNGIEVIVRVEEYGKGDTGFGEGTNYLIEPK